MFSKYLKNLFFWNKKYKKKKFSQNWNLKRSFEILIHFLQHKIKIEISKFNSNFKIFYQLPFRPHVNSKFSSTHFYFSGHKVGVCFSIFCWERTIINQMCEDVQEVYSHSSVLCFYICNDFFLFLLACLLIRSFVCLFTSFSARIFVRLWSWDQTSLSRFLADF